MKTVFLELLVFGFFWFTTIAVVRWLHGSDILAGGLGALVAARAMEQLTKTKD